MVEANSDSRSSLVNLTKTIIGAGLLSMPYAFSSDGMIFGTIITLIAAFTSGFGLYLQGYVSRYVPIGHATFFSVCSITYPSLSVVFDIAIAIQCFGCAVSYLVLIGDLMPTILDVEPFWNTSREAFWIILSAILCVPLSFLKNLSSLKYSSILGILAILYMSALVVCHAVALDVPTLSRGDMTLFPKSLSYTFSTFSILVFAYTGHQNMFSIINEEQDKSLDHIKSLIYSAVSISSALFLLVGISGYYTFGDKVGGNIILQYHNSWSTNLGRLSIVLMVIFSFPLMIHPARISVNNVYFWIRTRIIDSRESEHESGEDETSALLSNDISSQRSVPIQIQANIVPLSDTSFKALTTGLLIVGYYLAMSIKSFAFILALVGATGSTSISFILPGLFGYKLIGSDVGELSDRERILRYASLLLSVWGLCVMVICLYTSMSSTV